MELTQEFIGLVIFFSTLFGSFMVWLNYRAKKIDKQEAKADNFNERLTQVQQAQAENAIQLKALINVVQNQEQRIQHIESKV